MNKAIFASASVVPTANTVNLAGGKAYQMTSKELLAQYATTGAFNDTYYASGMDQVNEVLKHSKQVPAEYLAKLAIYARRVGMMKDMPAFLLAVLATRDVALLERVFPAVVND